MQQFEEVKAKVCKTSARLKEAENHILDMEEQIQTMEDAVTELLTTIQTQVTNHRRIKLGMKRKALPLLGPLLHAFWVMRQDKCVIFRTIVLIEMQGVVVHVQCGRIVRGGLLILGPTPKCVGQPTPDLLHQVLQTWKSCFIFLLSVWLLSC